VLGLVQLFKDAILQFPNPGTLARELPKKKKKKSVRAKKPGKSKKAKRRK
jgi:hypothetical protein